MKNALSILIIFIVNTANCGVDSLNLIYKSKFLVISDYYEANIDSEKIPNLMKTIDCKFVDNNLYENGYVCLKLTTKNIDKYKRFIYINHLDSLNSKKSCRQNYYNSVIFDDWLKKNFPVGEKDTISYYESIIGADNLKKINCEFVLVYNLNACSFYRLQGFKINEFYDFFNLISDDIYSKIYEKMISGKIFKTKKKVDNIILSRISIDGVDVKELYKNYYINEKYYPVDKCSCTKRDNFIIITSYLNRVFY
ncbi:MAG: hypothetical protein WCP69_02765 [Bacteroidota bacterium]